MTDILLFILKRKKKGTWDTITGGAQAIYPSPIERDIMNNSLYISGEKKTRARHCDLQE